MIAPVVLRTHDPCDLQRIRAPEVQAVVHVPPELPSWLTDLAANVTSRNLAIERTQLHGVTKAQISRFLDNVLVVRDSAAAEPWFLREFKSDVLGLVDLLGDITGAACFAFRILTDEPNQHCGFHVDTVPSGAVPIGLLRVYNGAGTDYVDPTNVTSMRDFYRFLGRRERLVREIERATALHDDETARARRESLRQLDAQLPFLKNPDRLYTAQAGSVVAFKHLDISQHWSDHHAALAWLHCSPMAGDCRLLVNIMPAHAWRSMPAQSRGASAPGLRGRVRA